MILMTGGTGFVGSYLVKALREDDCKVRVLVREHSDTKTLKELGIELSVGDVIDPASLDPAVDGVDTVIHLVSIAEERGAARFESICWRGTDNVVEVAKAAGIQRMIHMSALGVEPDERSAYLLNKWKGQQTVENSGLDYTVLRPSVIFGKGDGFFTKLASVIRTSPGIMPIIGSGASRFQPIWIEDVIRCTLSTLQNEEGKFSKKTLELGGSRILTFEEIVNVVMEAMQVRKPKVHLPAGLVSFGSRAMKAVGIPSPITPEQVYLVGKDNVTEPVDSVERHFGFEPRGLEAKHLDYLKQI
ncbi:MAG: SDR family oxidoreductase [Candidatus Bipolaricaulia bacterium]